MKELEMQDWKGKDKTGTVFRRDDHLHRKIIITNGQTIKTNKRGQQICQK